MSLCDRFEIFMTILPYNDNRDRQDDYYGGGFDNSNHGNNQHFPGGTDPWYNNPSPSGSPSKDPEYKDAMNHRFSPATIGS